MTLDRSRKDARALRRDSRPASAILMMLDDADDAPLPDPYVPRPSGAPRAGSSQPAPPSSTTTANETGGAPDPAVLASPPAAPPTPARVLPYQLPPAFRA